MFIGLAGTAAASGFAVTIYEWHVSKIKIDHYINLLYTICPNLKCFIVISLAVYIQMYFFNLLLA